MEVIVRRDATHAVDLVAALMAERIRAKPNIILGLATGRTMEQVYTRLIEHDLSFRECISFNLDEYIGLPPDDPGSYRHYMQTHLFSKTDFCEENIHIPNGAACDFKKAAAQYEALIWQTGRIDLQLLGIGRDGHIGFNEPLSAIRSRTRDKCLTEITRAQNAEMFGGDINKVPRRALTMGVGTILEARELILLATGSAKADIVARAVEGPITSMISASAIQLHPDCKVIVDEAAAAGLAGRDYYDFIFANEPEWATYR